MSATVYRVRASRVIVQQLLDGSAILPDHMKVHQVGDIEPDGLTCIVTFEDTQAPRSLDGKLIDPVFTSHSDGRTTVEYGDPVEGS